MAGSLINTYLSMLKALHNPQSAKYIPLVMVTAGSLCNTYLSVLKVPQSAGDRKFTM